MHTRRPHRQRKARTACCHNTVLLAARKHIGVLLLFGRRRKLERIGARAHTRGALRQLTVHCGEGRATVAHDAGHELELVETQQLGQVLGRALSIVASQGIT